MTVICRCIFFVLLMGQVNATCIAQGRPTLSPVPMDSAISITIVGVDKQLLDCYNLYGFIYRDDKDSIYAEFIVLKSEDSLRDYATATVKLCRVRTFFYGANGRCIAMPVDMGVQVRTGRKNDDYFLNFDPEGPEPVFMLCK